MTTPSTAAGRALLARLTSQPLKGTPSFTTTTSAWQPWPPDYSSAILAIEAEATEAELERVRAAVNATDYVITVLAALEEQEE